MKQLLALCSLLALSACQCGGERVNRAYSRLSVDPASIDFGLAAPGSTTARDVSLLNDGNADLKLLELAVDGAQAGSFLLEVGDERVLKPSQALVAKVSFRPLSEGISLARLVVRSDADNAEEIAVSLAGVARNPDPCVVNGAPKACTSPPQSRCTSDSTLVSYASPGACTGGFCDYTAQTVSCVNGCANGVCKPDPCIGVTCNSPPPCFTGGTCEGGSCKYQPAAGTSCDDQNACTHDDRCDATGLCKGTTVTCPQPTECVTAWACNGTATCSPSGFADAGTTCSGGCGNACDGAGTCKFTCMPSGYCICPTCSCMASKCCSGGAYNNCCL